MLSQRQFLSKDMEQQKEILLSIFLQIDNQSSDMIDMIDLLKS